MTETAIWSLLGLEMDVCLWLGLDLAFVHLWRYQTNLDSFRIK